MSKNFHSSSVSPYSDVIKLSKKNMVSMSDHSFLTGSDDCRENLKWKPWFEHLMEKWMNDP